MSMWNVSIELANKVYTYAYGALVFGAILTAVSTMSLFWASALRDRYSDEQIQSAKTDAAKADARTPNFRVPVQCINRIIAATNPAWARPMPTTHLTISALVSALCKHPDICACMVKWDGYKASTPVRYACMKDVTGRAKGGVARARQLSQTERSAIAKKAAQSRWATDLPKAEYTGELRIGDLVIPCAVLPDGTRVLSQRGVGRALGRSFGGATWKKRDAGGADVLPFYINANQLKSFIPNDLMVLLTQPVMYRHGKGGGAGAGLVATALTGVCNVWLTAREAHYRGSIRLNDAQLNVALRAEIIMRGLADIGIVGLVDEATGYQEIRDRDALQEILNAFLRKELAAWAKRFPDEFYQQIYRLRGWDRTGKGSSRPQVVAHYTKDIVYARLAPGIIEELERRNPSDHGRRSSKHHQWLTEDVGHPALAQHLYAVITLMRVSTTWDQFKAFLDSAHPVRGDTLKLPLMLESPSANSIPTSVTASETLPLFAQLLGASQGTDSAP